MTDLRQSEPGPDPQRLELNVGPMAPLLSLLGVPFIAVGVVAALVPLVHEPFVMRDFLAAMVASIVLVLTGLFLGVGWRAHVVFDRQRGTVTKRWGFIVPLRREGRDLDGLSMVVVSRGETLVTSRHGFRGPITWYSVRLEGQGRPFGLFGYDKHERALRAAERVAEFLKLDLHDETGESRA